MANMTMADWQTLSERINRVAPSATLAVDSKAKAMKAEGIDVIGFGAGEPNFPTPAAIVAAAAEAVQDPKNYRYTPTAGLPELRKAIADKTLRDSGYGVDPNQVIVTNGGKQAVYESFQILLNDGDEVIIPTPYWTSYPEAVKLAGGVPVEVFAGADRNFEPSLEDLEAARTERTKAIIVNTPNNPTGAVWNPETVKAIGEWAVEHHVWVISDEIYEHLNYDGAKTTYIGAAVPEVRDQLLVLNGVAKTYAMPGWRVGWMIAPLDVAKAASKLQGHMTSNVNNISQRAAIAAVSGSLDAVYEMREAFDRRRQTIVAALNDIEGVNCPTPTGAFYAFADVSALLNKPLGTSKTAYASTSELAAALLDEGHVAAVPGEAFGAPGYLRFSYALADDDLVEVHQAHGKEHRDRHMLAGAGDADFAADGKAHRLLADLAHRVVCCPSNCTFLSVRITDDALALGGDHGALNHLHHRIHECAAEVRCRADNILFGQRRLQLGFFLACRRHRQLNRRTSHRAAVPDDFQHFLRSFHPAYLFIIHDFPLSCKRFS